ncbi:hypothetical protein FG05_35009 [Fusarium graminearum]|nr:hypothetical protein FG05_35009 [Fusarium graminearum]
MSTQFSESAGDAMPTSQQDIRYISVTNGGMSFAGNFQNLTIANNQQGNSHTRAPRTLSLTFPPQVNFKDKIKNCSNHFFVSHPDIDRESLASAKGQRTPGTCQWILNDPQYQSWIAKEFPVLRISGGPGRGKTIMSLFLAEKIETLYQQKGDHLLSYFCQFQDDRYNDPHNVLRSLIYQLLQFSQDEPQVDKVLKYFETPEKKQSALGSLDCLWRILVILLSQPSLSTIFCIIDGIDECRSSEILTSKLYGYCASIGQCSTESKFQLVMLGRDIDGPITPHVINLDPDNDQSVNGDITKYITHSLEPLARIPGFTKLQPEITKTLSTRAEGTFLWVSFVVQELTRKRTCLQIQDAMEDLPKGLYPIFTRMLLAIDSKYHEISAEIFKWVAFAERPLTLDELAVASVDIHDEVNAKLIADRVAICRPFLRVHQEKVFFVHQSAKEYLSQSQQGQNLPPPKFQLIPDQCHDVITHKCLKVMENDFLLRNTADGQPDAGFEAWNDNDDFLRYAIEYWSRHARLSATQTQWLSDLNRPFLQDFAMRKSYSADVAATLSKYPIHFASYLGLASWLELLYRKTNLCGWIWISWRQIFSIDLRTPVEYAFIGRGDEMTIRFLLKHGSKISHEAIFNTILQGQPSAVQQILHHGVKTEVKSRYDLRETPLIFSVRYGRESMVRLLLDNNANIEAENEHGGTALMTAALKGDRAMVQLLIDHGANINANDDMGKDALIMAAKHGKSDVVQMLLDHGADIRTKDKLGMTALMHALIGCSELILKDLLRCGAEINANIVAQIDEPLVFTAAENKSQFVIDLVLENHACVDRRGFNGITPLIYTITEFTLDAVEHYEELEYSRYGFHFCIEMLQEGLTQERGMHASKQKDMISSLLHYGADVSLCAIVEIYDKPFFSATWRDVGPSHWPWHGTVTLDAPPLVCAAALGIDWAVGLLIEHGADCNLRAVEKYLCCGNLSPREKRLPECPAGHTKRQNHFRKAGSALVYAAQAGSLSTVQLLLSLGADTSIEDGFGMTALMWATQKEFREMERLLKAHEEERLVSSG